MAKRGKPAHSKAVLDILTVSNPYLELLNGELASAKRLISDRLNEMPVRYRRTYKEGLAGKSRKSAMHAFCSECIGWETGEIRGCTCYACPLWAYRSVREV